ncbi:MAG: hypothetical protein HYS27_28805 [Deltaproteobacteria bacterium]|nr:hypothetical protein [Deltaproteobacteria bacterium]
MHQLLRRQLKKHAPFGPDEVPDELSALLEAVGAAYEQADFDRGVLERSLDLSTAELKEKNAVIEEQKTDLVRSNDELAQFAYVASHDLQEPLRTVQSYLQLVKKRYAEKLDRDGAEFIDFAVEGATRMRALIESLLEYARVTSRAKPLEATAVDPVFDEVLLALAARVAEEQARIVRGVLPTVMADRRQLAQLLQNLLANALKFHKKGVNPVVHVDAERRGDEWLVRVKDEGIGLASEHREKIFAIFQRLHSRDEYEGTGVGLAVCKKILERHGGKLWVESTPGEGATFCFTLQAVPELPDDGGAS